MFDDSSFAQMVLNPQAGDERLHVTFDLHPMLNEAKTQKAGRPVYDDVEFIKILTPGDKDIYHQPALPHEKVRFRRQYEDFKAGKDSAISGTPLALLPGVTQGLVEEFAYFKIKTVEQLAELSDAVAVRMPGAQELKRVALRFVNAAKENAPRVQMQAELKQRDDEIAALKAQLDTLAASLAKGKK